MHFCHLRKAHNDPILTLDGTPIPVVEENTFLGVISSPEHEVLMVSYCDQSVCVVRRQQFVLKANSS